MHQIITGIEFTCFSIWSLERYEESDNMPFNEEKDTKPASRREFDLERNWPFISCYIYFMSHENILILRDFFRIKPVTFYRGFWFAKHYTNTFSASDSQHELSESSTSCFAQLRLWTRLLEGGKGARNESLRTFWPPSKACMGSIFFLPSGWGYHRRSPKIIGLWKDLCCRHLGLPALGSLPSLELELPVVRTIG